MPIVSKLDTAVGMKLSCYLTLHDLSVSDFAARLGIGSRMTLYRYATGLRRPNAAMLARIHQLTDGMVTAEDFPIVRSVPSAKRTKGNTATPKKRAKKKTYPDLSPVVQTAMQDLGDRADYQAPHGFWLDGRPVSLPTLIAAANQVRVGMGLAPLAYPLANPLGPDGRPQESLQQAIGQL